MFQSRRFARACCCGRCCCRNLVVIWRRRPKASTDAAGFARSLRQPMHMRSAIVSVALLVVAPACKHETPLPSTVETTTTATPTAGLADRDPALARRLVAAGALLIDVRTPSEYAERHLDGAINIPVDDLVDRSNEVETFTRGDKAKPIVVYCGAGRRAARAKTVLLAKGYSRVTNLGGIDDWDRK